MNHKEYMDKIHPLTTKFMPNHEFDLDEERAFKESELYRLRDQFAMAALTGILSRGDHYADHGAKIAYRAADAMLKARGK